MARLNTTIGKLTNLALHKPLHGLAVLIPLLILSVYGAFHIGFDDGLRTAFASPRPEYSRYQQHVETFAQNETNIAVLVSSAAPFDKDDLATLRDFTVEIQFVDGAEAVFSLFSLQKLDESTGNVEALFPVELEDVDDVAPFLEAAKKATYASLATISEDLTQTIVILSLEDRMSELDIAEPVLAEIRGIAKTFSSESNLTFAITGMLPIREFVIESVKSDQLWINSLGAAFGFAIALGLFRNFWIAVLNGLAPLIALLMCLGAFGLLGLSVNAVTNTLPVLILVLASSDCTHLTYEIRRNAAAKRPIKDAIYDALDDVGPPCILTSVTTILAFASLSYSDSPLIKSLALSGAVGITIAVVTILFVHPLVFTLGARSAMVRRILQNAPAPRQNWRWVQRIFPGVLARHKIITLSGAALCVAALGVMLPVQSKYSFLENMDPNSELIVSLNGIEAFAGPMTSIDVPLRIRGGQTLISEATLTDVKRVHEHLEQMMPNSAIASLLSLQRFLPEDMSPNALQDTLDELPERYRNRLVGKDARSFMVSIGVPDLGSQQIQKLVNDLEISLSELETPSLEIGRITGFLAMSAQSSTVMIKQLTISFLIAAIACSALIGAWFGRWSFAFASLVPNILPIALVGAWLTFVDRDIQFTSALALTIAFGIALDDSIHVFNRLHLQQAKTGGGFTPRAIAAAMRHITPALITTTAILSVGLLASQVSDLPLVRFFGVLCVTTFALALLADLLILPAIVAFINNRARPQEK